MADTEKDSILPHEEYEGDEEVNDQVTVPKRRVIVEPMLLLFTLSFMIQIPVFGQYLYYIVGVKYNLTSPNETRAHKCQPYNQSDSNDTEKNVVDKIQEISTMWSLYINLASGITGLIVSPIYSSLTDKLGRKWPFIVVGTGELIRVITNLLCIIYQWPLEIFILTNIIGGLTGSWGTFLAAIFSYLADITTPKERPFRIAVAEGMFGLSAAVTQVGVGYWLKFQPYQWPYGLAAIVSILNLCYAIFFVPEIRKRQTMGCSLWDSYKRIFSIFTVRSRNTTAMTFAIIGLVFLCFETFAQSIEQQYELGFPFCWGSFLIGIKGSISAILMEVGMVVSVGMFSKCFNMKPLSIALIGIVSSLASKLITGFSTTSLMLLSSTFAGVFSMIPIPMIRSFLSIQVTKDEQGAVFASTAAIELFCALFGSTLVSAIYRLTVHWFPGFVFLLLAGLAVIALTFISVAAIHEILKTKDYEDLDNPDKSINASQSEKY